MVGGALWLLAACTKAEVKSPGNTNPVTVITNPGGGTGGSNFAARPSRPTSAGDCPVGTEFDPAFVLPDGQTTSVCKIDSANGPVTGNVDISFTADPIALVGAVFVGADGGATGELTFAPGQVVFGSDATAALFVSRGSKLFADGSQLNPIVFTSFFDLNDNGAPDGSSASQEWGGLVLNGFAPINDCTVDTSATPGSAACEKDGEGGSGRFGGDNPADSSGVLRFVRVQQAGTLFNSTNELNGVAFQGVGNGTVVDFLQIHKAADDSIEFFGGTVQVKHIVSTGAEDDNFDWTDGWRGALQFGLVVQDPSTGNRGIEADNREGAPDLTPRSNPKISNITMIGRGAGAENDGVKFRRGTDATLINAIVAGFGLDGLDFDQDTTAATPTVDSTLFAGNNPNIEASAATQAIFNAGAKNQTAASPSLTDVFFPGPVEQGVSPTDPTTLGSFFSSANYVGAFSPTEDPSNNWTSGWTIGLGAAAGCPNGTTEFTADAVPAGRSEARICKINRPVIGDVTLSAGNLYVLDGSTFIGQDMGPDPANPLPGGVASTLAIAPGVTLYGLNGEDALVVNRGSKIFVNGAKTAPVIMTSRQDVFGQATSAGQWGGLILNGRASINDCTVDTSATPGSVNCQKDGEGATGMFGGATDDDNSGRINFLRVQYAGFLFNSTNELNGIAFQGVGSGTEVDFVQVHANADDGVEFFGGAVTAKHMIMTDNEDDSFDWTDGWRGKIQYAIAKQSSVIGNRLIEADNREGAPDNLPRSHPLFSNFTLFGTPFAGGDSDGVKLRRGTSGDFYNMIITNARVDAIDYDGVTPAGETPRFHTSLIIDTASNGTGTPGLNSTAASAGVFSGANGNSDLTTTTRGMTAPSGFTTPLILSTTETNAVTPTMALSTSVDSFFDDVAYIGAVRDSNDDWYKGWTLPGSF